MKSIQRLVLALASLVGPWHGETRVALWNEAKTTAMSAPFWKGKHAEAIGKPEMANCSDEDQLMAHDAHMKMANEMMDAGDDGGDTSMGNEALTEAQTALANEKAKVTGVEAKLSNEKTRADQAEQTLANERKERASELVALALVNGKIKPADKAAWEADFAKDFAEARAKLGNAKTVIKTTALTGNLGERNHLLNDAALSNEKARTIQVNALVNEKMKANPTMTYDAAWAVVQAENPVIFEAMAKPEPKK